MEKTVTNMTSEQFNVLIGQIKRLGKLTNHAIQRAAVFAVYQSIEHRNSTPADTLLKAMPAGARRQSLICFFERFGNLCYAKTTKKVEFFDVLNMTGMELDEFNEEKLMATQWHTMIKEPDLTSAWDVSEQLDKVLSKLEKAIDHETREVLNAGLIKKVRLAIAEYNAA
jgi:hypothetical protein